LDNEIAEYEKRNNPKTRDEDDEDT